MNDSGNRRAFETGAVRDRAEGKGRPELLSPQFLVAVSRVLEEGARKYAARNWEKGMPFSDVCGSLFRHLLAWMMGKNDEDHLAHLACNVMFLIHFRELHRRGKLPAGLADMGPPLLNGDGAYEMVPLKSKEDVEKFYESAGKK